MDDETLLRTVKNGLMIAGHEMGPVGDHWPAIHAVVKGVETEFEQIHRDEAVLGELEFHTANLLRDLEDVASDASPHDKKKIMDFVDQVWQRYYAILEPVDAKCAPDAEDLVIPGVNEFKHMKAASHIIRGLGGRA